MWTAHDYEDSDFTGILNLVDEYYGSVEISNSDYIKWEYFDNPAGEAIIKVAKNEVGEIVGQYILIPVIMRIFGKQIKVTLSLNTLTKTDYLKQGIFTALCKNALITCKNEQYAFTYGYPNKNSYYGFTNKLGFTDLHKIPLLIYPCDIKSLVNKKLSKTLAIFTPNISFGLNKNASDTCIVEINKDNMDLLDIFWDKVKDKYPIMVARDKNFLKWRYIDVPTREYNIYIYTEEADIFGYIITTIRNIDGIKNGLIVDFLIQGNDYDVGKKLIYKAFKLFRQNNAELVGCLMLKHTAEYSVLKKCGFIRTPRFLEPQPFPLIYRGHQEEYTTEQIMDIQNWFVSMGDYDAV